MTHSFRLMLQVLLAALAVFLLLGLIGFFLRRRRIAQGKPILPLSLWRALLTAALIGDILVTVMLTLVMRGTVTLTQFHPLASWREAWNAWSPELFAQLFLNIIAFVPFGALLAMRFPALRRLWAIGGISFGFSLAIETLQLLFQRGVFDVDDLFCNTLGGVLGGALVCVIVHLHARKLRRAVAAAGPILLSGIACAVFFGAYAAQPYGNLSIAANYRYPMDEVDFSVAFPLNSVPAHASVYVKQTYTEAAAVTAAESILAGLNLSTNNGKIQHFNAASCFDFPDEGVYLNYTRDGGSWYLCHSKTGTHPAPVIGNAEALSAWLSGFDLDLRDAVITYAGNHLWYVDTAPVDDAPAGRIICSLRSDGAWSIQANTPTLCKVADESILTPAEVAETIREGGFRWFYDQISSFSSLSLTQLTLTHRTDTKGYLVPVWQAAVTVSGQKAVILIPALK